MKFSNLKKELLWVHGLQKNLVNETRGNDWVEARQKDLDKQMLKIQKEFRKEYESYLNNDEFFFCCPFSIYKSTYQFRLDDYLDRFPEANEFHFLESEIKCDFFDNPDDYNPEKQYLNEFIEVIRYLNLQDKSLIHHSLDKRNNFLTERANELGYKLDFFHFGNETEWKYEIKPMDISESNIPKGVDLSDTKDIDKVRYLIEMGIIDYLHDESYFNKNINRMASALSAVTGMKHTSIYPYLNSYLQNKENKNNPMKDKTIVLKIKHSLRELGFVRPS